jgi:hypothetical protein
MEQMSFCIYRIASLPHNLSVPSPIVTAPQNDRLDQIAQKNSFVCSVYFRFEEFAVLSSFSTGLCRFWAELYTSCWAPISPMLEPLKMTSSCQNVRKSPFLFVEIGAVLLCTFMDSFNKPDDA